MTTFLHRVARETQMGQAPAPEVQGSTESRPTSKEGLVDLVLDVVANADWSQPGMDGRLGRSRTARGEVLLATLTYCYAWGIYSAGEIEAAILCHRNNAELLDRMPLDRKAFAQFRRYNRDLIKSCLTQVLGQINSGRFASLMDAYEAEQRIQRAVECDCMESEE